MLTLTLYQSIQHREGEGRAPNVESEPATCPRGIKSILSKMISLFLSSPLSRPSLSLSTPAQSRAKSARARPPPRPSLAFLNETACAPLVRKSHSFSLVLLRLAGQVLPRSFQLCSTVVGKRIFSFACVASRESNVTSQHHYHIYHCCYLTQLPSDQRHHRPRSKRPARCNNS